MRLFAISLIFTTSLAHADVIATFRDGNPYDRFWLQNTGCASLKGTAHIDMTNSAGHILIDTLRGGPGTKDPMPVAVERGNITLVPPQDGDRTLTINIHNLQPNATAIITLDLDGDTGWWPATNVGVEPEEMQGSVLTLSIQSVQKSAIFNANASARIQTPTDCPNKTAPTKQEKDAPDLIS